MYKWIPIYSDRFLKRNKEILSHTQTHVLKQTYRPQDVKNHFNKVITVLYIETE